ncbi:uncharacterized protein LOC129582498 isoform X2 [Paramacrobiotus metropolitanus]|uniref:uncharacterized protein LOC129582498 isoform X2 n=1 Tax=Paramacrobiotus metropolitanus TaxID=2943436 RepID=UPI002445F99A|nr:uncharacterized protein LOC129582498 isoform X2 [Paramacrobiotus metropolitanus]
MTSWTSRVHRRAETMRQAVTNCGHSHDPYPKRFEKVKFGIPVEQVCKNDIPAPLLVLILKINKQGPYKKDVFRAPGHQGNIKKLIHFLQTGRLVNIEHYSVYTIASVLKKFLRKLPGGIFGQNSEERLFDIIQNDNPEEQRKQIHGVIGDLSIFAQRLLVLLFGTFRVIAMHAENGGQSGMSAEALGVSVAPSFFMSCISNGKQAKLEDIQRYKLASRIITFMIDNFATNNLFGRGNYEYYARITGRVLRVDEDWIFAFDYPHDKLKLATTRLSQHKLAHKHSWLQLEALKWGMAVTNECISPSEETAGSIQTDLSPVDMRYANIPKIVMSASDHGSFGQCSGVAIAYPEKWDVTSEENTRSLSFLPIVHERQAARMRTRSEWFLAPARSVFDVDIEESTSVPASSCDDRMRANRSSLSFSSQEHSRDTAENISDRAFFVVDNSPLVGRLTNLPASRHESFGTESEQRFRHLTLNPSSAAVQQKWTC